MPRIIIFVLLLLCSANTVFANNIVSGNIEYKWLNDSTYQFICKLYIDCMGNSEPDSLTLCANNTCANNSFTTTLHKYSSTLLPRGVANGSIVPPGCAPHPPTRCSDTSSKLPGIKEWWYVDTVTLPARCSNWVFSVKQNGRVNNHNYSAQNFYTEATLNNQLSLQNSSPRFDKTGILFLCLNQPYTYKDEPTDIDGDSIVTKLIRAKTSQSTSCPFSSTNLGVNTVNPAINFTNNPFQTNNTFILDTLTGEFKFIAGAIGSNLLSLLLEEYRNGTLIGTTFREISIQPISCAISKPLLDLSTNSPIKIDTNTFSGGKIISNPRYLIACRGQKLYFDFILVANDTSAMLSISDDHNISFPTANVNYSYPRHDSVLLHFEWTPTNNDSGWKKLDITIADTACRPPIGFLTYILDLDIYIPSRAFAGNDTAICAHEPMLLKGGLGYLGGSYKWVKLPGATGGLTCDTCDIAIATPTSTSRYALTSSANWCPDTYHDTIEVSILNTPVTYPTTNITVLPDSNVWPGLNVAFNASTTNCTNITGYQWQVNGKDVSGATNSTWNSTTLKDKDIVSCNVACGDTCPDPRLMTSNYIKMNVATSIPEVDYLNELIVYPNPNNGEFTLLLPPNVKSGEIEVVNTLGQIVYRQHIRYANENVQINLSHLNKGIHILRFKANNKAYVLQFTKTG